MSRKTAFAVLVLLLVFAPVPAAGQADAPPAEPVPRPGTTAEPGPPAAAEETADSVPGPGTPLWSEQLVILRDSEGRYGFGDMETGRFVIPPRYEDARLFSEERAAVMIDGRWGFINPGGRMTIPARYGRAHAFFNGLAAVRRGQEWFFINRDGERVAAPPSLDGDLLPAQILVGRELEDINPGYVRVMGPADFRLQEIPLPADSEADRLARGILEYQIAAELMRAYNYEEARPHLVNARDELPPYTPGHRLAVIALQRVDLILAADIELVPPETERVTGEDDFFFDEEDDWDDEEDW